MASQDVPGVESALGVIDTVDDSERAALDSVRRFLESVDQALPGGGDRDEPSRRLEVIEAGLKMIERLLGVSNDFARRITESVGEILPDLSNLLPDRSPAPEPAPAPAKKAPAKKAPAKKAPAKKAPAKKAAAKKAPAKKAAAKKAPAKRPAARG